MPAFFLFMQLFVTFYHFRFLTSGRLPLIHVEGDWMKLKHIAIGAMLGMSIGHAQASYASIFPESITAGGDQDSQEQKAAQIAEKVVTLPVTGVLATEKGGQVVVITTNGRYTIVGQITDNWSKKSLNTLESIRESAQTIPIKDMKINLQELEPISIGNGPKNIVIFTDPYCGYCKKVIEQAKNVDQSKYTVQIMMLGLLGKESEQRVADIYCAEDKRTANALFLAGDNTTDIKRASGTCDAEAFMKRSVAAQLFGVNAVPFIIREDGRYISGIPKSSLNDFLNQ